MSYSDGYAFFDNDLNAIVDGIKGNGVISGLSVAERASPTMGVTVAVGYAKIGEKLVTLSSATNVTVTTADGTHPRKDVISIDSSGSLTCTAGTPGAASPSGLTGPDALNPIPPNIPSGELILGEIWVAASVATILDAVITDRRMLITESQSTVVVGGRDCDGIADEVQVNNAVDSLPDTGGTVILTKPIYTQAAPIYWAKHGVQLLGLSAKNTVLDISAVGKFSGYINGSPSVTSVVYDDGSGGDPASESNLVPHMVLWNTTQGEWAHITAINTTTNTITLQASSPHDVSGWANNDVIEGRASAIYVNGLAVTESPASLAERTVLGNFKVVGSTNSGPGIHIENLNRSNKLSNIYCYDCGKAGVFSSTGRILIMDLVECVGGDEQGILIISKTGSSANTTVLNTCRAVSNGGVGIEIDGTDAYADALLIDCIAESNSSDGIKIVKAATFALIKCHLESNVGAYGIHITGTATADTLAGVILGGQFQGGGAGKQSWGIYINYAKNISMDGCHFNDQDDGGSIQLTANAADCWIGAGNNSLDSTKLTDNGSNTTGFLGFDHVLTADWQAQVMARAYLTAGDQTIGTGSSTKVTLDAETYDIGADFDSATNNRFVAPVTGYYDVFAQVKYVSPVADKVYRAQIKRNGATLADSQAHASNTGIVCAQVADTIYMAAAQYVELFTEHNAGGDETIGAGTQHTYMAVSLKAVA